MSKLKKNKSGQTRSNGNRTRTKILESAEYLFGTNGYDAVSLRDITNRAEVTLALASYHFGTKDQLFAEVVAQRAEILGHLRLEQLAILQKTKQLDVRSIMAAFMGPLFEQVKSDDSGWQSYVKVLSRVGEYNKWVYLFVLHFNPTALKFIDALCEVMPTVPRDEVVRVFSFTIQIMLQTAAQHNRIESLTEGALLASDLDGAYAQLLSFVSAGLENLNQA